MQQHILDWVRLLKVLDTITDAFRKVYNSLKGTELTPELKSLFDDLLSKSQQKEINKKKA